MFQTMSILNASSFLTLSLILLVFNSCHKKHTPPDPCQGKTPFTANFFIKEEVGDSLVITDTVLQYSFVQFEAAGDYDSYEWKIGADPRSFTTKKVRLLFLEIGSNITIQLKATKRADPCFPNAKTEETISKSFDVVHRKYAPIIGKYAGYFDSDKINKDTVEVRLTPTNDPPFDEWDVLNINRGCNKDASMSGSGSVGARAYSFDKAGVYYNGCKSPEGFAFLKSRDTMIVNFTYKELGSSEYLKDKFMGIRIK